MRRASAAATLACLLCACASVEGLMQPSKGYYAFKFGLQQFEEGDYADASRNLQSALERGLAPGESVVAHKHLAFIHCVSGRALACRDEFRKALAINSSLTLAPAEAGHPAWGPVFTSVKAEAAKGQPARAEAAKIEAAKAEPAKAEPAKAEAAKADAPLQVALRQYEDGDYDESAKTLQSAIDQGLPPKDRATAYKHLAFIHCAENRQRACRDEFRKALAVDPSLDLTPAEAGHPVWGPIFRALKAQR
jgi:Tfp pilus assembly protein PilF